MKHVPLIISNLIVAGIVVIIMIATRPKEVIQIDNSKQLEEFQEIIDRNAHYERYFDYIDNFEHEIDSIKNITDDLDSNYVMERFGARLCPCPF